MKKTIIFLICSISTILIEGQTNLSIAKLLCKCEPLTVSKIYPENKLYFITDEEEDFEHTLILKSAEKIGTRWQITKNEKLASDYSYASQDEEVEYPYENFAIINGKEYFYSIISLANQGTAYNGQNRYVFIFKNPSTAEQFSINYERWSEDPAGEYSILNNKDLSEYRSFIAITNTFVDAAFGVEDTDINSINNFNTNWLLENADVYDNAESSADDLNIIFTEYQGKELYNEYSESAEQLTEGNYTVLSGFATPILAFDKQKNKTLVLYIPNGWPNGCCWGDRSFKLKSFKNKIITLEDENYVLIINIYNQKFSTIIKNK